MPAVVRTYSGAGAKALFDLLEKRKADVESVMRSVPGFVSYTLIHGGNGGASITVCKDKGGTDKSMAAAKEWIQKNAANTGAPPPTVVEGTVLLHLK
jgi:hypothetical protein